MRFSIKIHARGFGQYFLGRAANRLALLAIIFCSALQAQPAFYEAEPNNTPAEANKISGAVTIMGTMAADDQDGFLWSVSDVEAQKRWTLELNGIPGSLTIVEIIRLEYADNGVDIADKNTLFVIGSRDGSKPVLAENLYFEPGEYILGVASAGGGESSFRPEIKSLEFGDADKSAIEKETKAEIGGYRLVIREGKTLYLAAKPPQNETREAAQIVQLGRHFGAFSAGTDSWFQFDVSEQQSGTKWNLEGQVPVSRSASAFLRDTDGNELTRTITDKQGKFAFRDLGFDVGTYYIEIKAKQGDVIRAIESESVGLRIEGAEVEPNDSWKLANGVDFDQDLVQAVTGRMGRHRESDFFRFSLDEATVSQMLSLRLEAGAEQDFSLCLLDAKGADVQCRKGIGSVELPDLVLQPGDWGLVVRGPDTAEYSISLTQQGPILAGIELEPNDMIEYASTIPSNNRIKGRFSGQDYDFYRIVVTDTPQLWRFQVIGDDIHELAYHDGAGIQSQVYRVPTGQRRVRLDNVFLLPGIHHVRVSGHDGGKYTLLAKAIGPPDPNGEFEPNDDTSRMQPLRFGQTRTGLLADKADRDIYRFYLGHWDRIRLTLESPADGEIAADLYWDTKIFKQFNNPQTGQKVELDGLFPPGDYRINLRAKKTSEAEYKISLERLKRFGCPSDCEPNDNFDFANPLPANRIVEGRVNEWRDADWYELPVFDQPTEMTAVSETRRQIAVVEPVYSPKSLVVWNDNSGIWRGTIPAGVQTYLQIPSGGEPGYRFELSFADQLPAYDRPTEMTLELSLKLTTQEVGAYRQYGQEVVGTLELSNGGGTSINLELEAASSDYRWSLELQDQALTIPAGGQHTVPLLLHVPADAWADWPVRISVKAANEAGAQVETSIDIHAGRETPAVNAVYGWTLPEELRGGFNVAWQALGGRWTGKEDRAIGWGFAYLIDGMAVKKQGLQLRGGIERRTVDVIIELAGEKPVEVVGLTLNELSGAFAPQFLRNLDFALSLDGVEFTPVVEGELLPVKAEQAIVLDQPVLARFARLQLKSGWDGVSRSSTGFGELKVIARPGTDISAGKGFNLADPTLGGHIVWSRPAIDLGGWDLKLLRDEDKWQRLRLKDGQTQDFVIGFHHARAAQINRIEWLDAEKAEDARKLRQVALSVSSNSPIGPWTPIGNWDLTNSGSPAIFELEQPVWARYVKFSASGGNLSGNAESPAVIRIWERPGDDEYRSILAEWGFASQSAIYEELHPLQVEKPFEAANHNARDVAAFLEMDQLVGGQVILGAHEHWYKLVVPHNENTLTLSIGGELSVRTVVYLESSDGKQIPIRKNTQQSTPQLHIFEALVEPGSTCFLKIEEPPRNVVFLWDTSASVGAYLPVIYNSLIAYMEDVVPGRDAANLIPFGGRLLLRDWYGEPYILQTVLNDYPRKESSSEADKTMHTASKALAPRAGTKAIVMVTDAATIRYPAVWDEFDRVQPRIFALGLGSQGALHRDPAREQDLMQDWSRVNGGYYSHVLSEGEMGIAFDRAATMLRRPAGYSLEVTGSYRETPGPGSLTVVAKEGASASGAIELILDASGSMLKRMDGKRRINIAKEVLIEAVNQHIPPGTQVALRVFGHKEPNSCRSDLEIALKPLDPVTATRTIEGITAMNLAKTPIADSLAKIESDLKQVQGRKVIVLVTDGEETCDGDAEKVIRRLRDKGFDVSLNIVGFAIDDATLESQFQSWAELGGGRYFSAKNQQGLSQALEVALKIPYSVYDQNGSLVAEGEVGGAPLELQAGFYRVSVATSPAKIFDKVEIPGEEQVTLELDHQ
jgi:hypothetical protein